MESLEFLYLCCELSIGLIGFTAIVAAFGGRDRSFTGPEQVRIWNVFLSGGCVLATSFIGIAVIHSGLEEAIAFQIMGVAGIVGMLANGLPAAKDSIKFLKDDTKTTGPWSIVLSFVSGIAVVGCFIAAVFVAQLWLISIAFGIYLTIGVVMFFRLLTRLN